MNLTVDQVGLQTQKNITSDANPVAPQDGVKEKRRIKILLVIFFLIFLLSGIFYLFYTKYYLSPHRITAKMVESMLNVGSFDYAGEANVNLQGDFSKFSNLLPNKYLVNLSFIGSGDLSDKNSPKFTSDVSLTAQNLISINFDSRFVDNYLYFNVKNIPDFGFPDTDKFINRWMAVRLPHQEPDKDSITPNKLQSLFENHKPYQSLRLNKDEIVDGQKTFHLGYVVDKENLHQLVLEILKIRNGNVEEGDIKTLSKLKDSVSFREGSLFVDKKSYMLRKMILSFFVAGNAEMAEEIIVDLEVGLKNFNTKLNITSPADSHPVEEIFSHYTSSNNF